MATSKYPLPEEVVPSGRTQGEHPEVPPKDGPTKVDAVTTDRQVQGLIRLSQAVTTPQPNVPYVMKDSSGRTLCWNYNSVEWGWAFVGDYEQYQFNVCPIYFSDNPATGSMLRILPPKKPYENLCTPGSSTNWEWSFWCNPTWNSGSYPELTLKAEATGQPGQFKLTCLRSGTSMRLAADSGTWNWLYLSSSASPATFTFHKFYVDGNKVADMIRATWPGSTFDFKWFQKSTQPNFGDRFFEAIDDNRAKAIYQNSGLSNYRWSEDFFDCDDFSYVYKGQASKDAYAAQAEYGYAVGVIFGDAPEGAHAVNLFIDPRGNMKILEPQGGSIVDGSQWINAQGKKYSPYFVLV